MNYRIVVSVNGFYEKLFVHWSNISYWFYPDTNILITPWIHPKGTPFIKFIDKLKSKLLFEISKSSPISKVKKFFTFFF